MTQNASITSLHVYSTIGSYGYASSAKRISYASYGHYIDHMASEQWNDDIAYAMNYIKLITWPIGVWPLQVYNTFSIIRCLWGIFSASTTMLLSIIEIYVGCASAEQNLDNLMLIFCGFLGIIKMISFRIYAKNLTDNYASAVNDYKNVKIPRDYSIMRQHTYIGRLLCCCMLGASYISIFILIAIAFWHGNKAEPIVTTNKTVYERTISSTCALKYFHVSTSVHIVIFFMKILTVFTTCNTNIGNDSLFVSIVLHVCGQMKILNTKFVDLNAASLHDYDQLNILIKRHIYLIRNAKKLTETVNVVLLVQLSFMSILICIMGFQFILAVKMNNTIIIGKSLIMQFVFLTQLSQFSFIGDYLISQMEEIALSIYQTTWYKFSDTAKKNMIFIIMRRESPVALQAGNFIMINLSTFMNILKTSLSYLSVLRVMMET